MYNDNFTIVSKNLTKKFGQFTAVDTISFKIKKGEVFGFLGANGAGKTTAVKMLCGLVKPTSGDAFISGYSITKDTEKVKKSIGYMSQKFSLYNDLNVRENIRFYGGIYGLSRKEIKSQTDKILFELDLSKKDDKLIKDLPVGWRQRLAFSIATIHNPQIVFLDEPTSGVDPKTRRQFWDMIYQSSEKGVTIFITTHYMDEAEYCKRIGIMSYGKIKDIGSPQELKNKYIVKNIYELFIKLTFNK